MKTSKVKEQREEGSGGGQTGKEEEGSTNMQYFTAALAPPTCHIFSKSWSGALCLRACRIFFILSLR